MFTEKSMVNHPPSGPMDMAFFITNFLTSRKFMGQIMWWTTSCFTNLNLILDIH